MKRNRSTRRRFLQSAAGAGIGLHSLLGIPQVWAVTASDASASGAPLADANISLQFDHNLHLQLSRLHPAAPEGAVLLHSGPTDFLELRDGSRIDQFVLSEQTRSALSTPAGAGTRLTLRATAGDRLEKTTQVELFARYPGFAFYHTTYRNTSTRPLALKGWTNLKLSLPRLQVAVAGGDSKAADFWSFCGSTHSDRRDWVQAVRPGFTQQNYMGMSASDYGGGTPIVDVWRHDGGLAIGHVATVPQLVSLPLTCDADGATVSMTAALHRSLAPGETLTLPESFIAVHTGDYFSVLDTYRRVMGERGLSSPPPPPAAYEPIWCAWGYERSCTVDLIEKTLPKVQDLGLRWVVIDDGWQSNVGDWNLSHDKYPRGEADMKQMVANIRNRNLKPRLWWTPLAAAPGSDLLHDHTDMLLLDKDGAVQNVSWWNSFYLCPAYKPTVDYTVDLVRRFIGRWGFAGLKIDGQHLNAVAPCYNPAHHHARPEESVEGLQDLFQAVYQEALRLDPHAVVELCPCGTSYSFFNFRSFNQAPASDPESSWQVRHKGKTLKALMGPSAAFAGDHVELSAGGRDFASTVGIGGIISTKFTWPADPKPKDSFLLTPEKEQLWRKWIGLYNERQLPQGTYRGELYDIGFDKPETHVVEKSGRLYYAFYAPHFSGPVQLRGLTAGNYNVRDYFNGRTLGSVSSGRNGLDVAFSDFLVIEAVPT